MYIVATQKFGATGDRLVKAFKKAGHEARQVRDYSGRSIRATGRDLVINWGCVGGVQATAGKVLNPKVYGKILQLEKFIKHGIPQPLRANDAITIPFHKGTLVRNPNGFGGKDIILCKTQREFDNAKRLHPDWMHVQYIPKVMELRLHVCGKTLIGMSKKIPQNINDVTWNNHTGAKQDTYRNATMEKFMTTLGVDAVKAVGYDFGAVDVIFDKYGTPYVLEVNSAPALISNEDRINGWVEAFVKMND